MDSIEYYNVALYKLQNQYRRRRTATLVRMWRELNSWKWPKEIGESEPANRSDPKRSMHMNAILCVLGFRAVAASAE